VKKALQSILNTGINDSLDLYDQKFIKVLNIIALISLAITVVGEAVSLAVNGIVIAPIFHSSLSIIIYSLVLFLNKRGKYNVSKIIVVVLNNLLTISVAFTFSQHTKADLLILINLMLYVAFFKSKRLIISLCVLTLLVILLVNYFQSKNLIQPIEILSETLEMQLRLIFICITVFCISFFTLAFKSTNEDYEKKLLSINTKLERSNKEIIDSITYAKRIQDAILPPIELIKQKLPDCFVLYKPKDIVAGDFYWMEEVNDTIFIAAADCTGHGVPGAMVSVLCSTALKRTVKEFNLTETGAILNKVRELVIETFVKSNQDVKDGMDISMLSVNKVSGKIQWSGANNPLWYFENGQLKEIRADKQPIGKSDHFNPFTTHTIEYKPGTIFYY
jgi:hypothetical protein